MLRQRNSISDTTGHILLIMKLESLNTLDVFLVEDSDVYGGILYTLKSKQGNFYKCTHEHKGHHFRVHMNKDIEVIPVNTMLDMVQI